MLSYVNTLTLDSLNKILHSLHESVNDLFIKKAITLAMSVTDVKAHAESKPFFTCYALIVRESLQYGWIF